MMKTLSKIALISLLPLLTGVTSCIKQDNYPIEPVITFKEFGVLKSIDNYDSIGRLTISYTDGDGDIGLYDTDTVEPYRYNFFLKFLYRKNGEMVELIPADTTLGFNARIPILTPTGRN
jgi:hypothetical protein